MAPLFKLQRRPPVTPDILWQEKWIVVPVCKGLISSRFPFSAIWVWAFVIAWTFLFLPGKVHAQLEFISPIKAKVTDAQGLNGVILLDTRDFHFQYGAES